MLPPPLEKLLQTPMNAPVKQRTDYQAQHLQNHKKHSKIMHSKQPWHISDRLECWPMPSEYLICKILDFKRFGKVYSTVQATVVTLHITPMKVIGKYGNTTYISKIWPGSNKPQFLIKSQNSRWKRKAPAVATPIVTVCARKKFVSVTLCVFAQGLRLATCPNTRCSGVDRLVHTTLGSNSTVWCD